RRRSTSVFDAGTALWSVSVVPSQVYPSVHVRDFVRVSVEHERAATAELADPALARLRPPRMVDLGIDVRVEAILVRRGDIPRRRRFALHKCDLHDRLDPLEAVLPRCHQTNRRAVLIGEWFAVQS